MQLWRARQQKRPCSAAAAARPRGGEGGGWRERWRGSGPASSSCLLSTRLCQVAMYEEGRECGRGEERRLALSGCANPAQPRSVAERSAANPRLGRAPLFAPLVLLPASACPHSHSPAPTTLLSPTPLDIPVTPPARNDTTCTRVTHTRHPSHALRTSFHPRRTPLHSRGESSTH
jgi:hypothetical protein